MVYLVEFVKYLSYANPNIEKNGFFPSLSEVINKYSGSLRCNKISSLLDFCIHSLKQLIFKYAIKSNCKFPFKYKTNDLLYKRNYHYDDMFKVNSSLIKPCLHIFNNFHFLLYSKEMKEGYDENNKTFCTEINVIYGKHDIQIISIKIKKLSK